jgi:hypothetical protein
VTLCDKSSQSFEMSQQHQTQPCRMHAPFSLIIMVSLLFLVSCVMSETTPSSSYVRPVNADCFAKEFGSSLGPGGSLFPSGFVMDGESTSRDEGGVSHVSVDSAIGFDVVYYDTYKVVTNGVSNQTYVLYVCGSDRPSADAPGIPDGAKFFQIPLTSISVSETVPYAYLEALGVIDRVHDVSPFVTSACGQKLVNTCGGTSPSYVDYTDFSFNTTAVEESGKSVDAIIVGSGQGADEDIVLAFDAENDPGVLNRAEWIKYLGLFFNKEKYASDVFNGIVEAYSETSDGAKKNGESKPTVAWVSHFSYDDDEHFDVSFADYKNQYVNDVNGQPAAGGMAEAVVKEYPGARISAFSPTTVEFAWDGSGDSFESKEAASKAFIAFLSTLDAVIDETYSADPSAYDFKQFEKEFGLDKATKEQQEALSWLEPRLIYRLDGAISSADGYDWFESSFVRPDLALKDVNRVVDSARNGKAIDQGSFQWMRNIDENPVVTSDVDCDRLASCSDEPSPICPFVAPCEDGGTRLLSEDSINTGACSYDACISSVGESSSDVILTGTAQMAAPAVILLTVLIVFVEALINFC